MTSTKGRRDRPTQTGWGDIRENKDVARLRRWVSEFGATARFKLDSFGVERPLVFELVEMNLVEDVADALIMNPSLMSSLKAQASGKDHTLWHSAASSGSVKMLEMLSDRASRSGINLSRELLSTANDWGFTAFDFATRSGNWDSALWILKRTRGACNLERLHFIVASPMSLFSEVVGVAFEKGINEKFTTLMLSSFVGNLKSPGCREPGEANFDYLLKEFTSRNPSLDTIKKVVMPVLSESFSFGEVRQTKILLDTLIKGGYATSELIRDLTVARQNGTWGKDRPVFGDVVTPPFVDLLMSINAPVRDWVPKMWESALYGNKFTVVRKLLAEEKNIGVCFSSSHQFQDILASVSPKSYEKKGYLKTLAEMPRELWGNTLLKPDGFSWLPQKALEKKNVVLLEFIFGNFGEELKETLSNPIFSETIRNGMAILPPADRSKVEEVLLKSKQSSEPSNPRRMKFSV